MKDSFTVNKWLSLLYLMIGGASAYFAVTFMIREHIILMDIRTINLMGIPIALLLWGGKEIGRKMAIGLAGYNLIALIFQLYLVFYDYLKDLPSITQEHSVSLIADLRSIANNTEFILIISAFLALFQMWILWLLVEKKDAFH
jgi:hypothetical protein